jgi:uncharacterized cupredoxin-like copper-binding protein
VLNGPRSIKMLVAVTASLVLAGCAASNGPNWTVSPPTAAGSSVLATPTAAKPSAQSTPTATESAVAASTQSPEPAGVPVSGPTSGPIGVPASGTAIYLSEWSVGLPTSMLAGQVNFAITNIGTIQHELLVFKSDLPPSSIPVDSKGDVIPDGPGMSLVSTTNPIDPGKSTTQVVDLTQPGTYIFLCNMPGHFMAGMYRVVTVTSPSQQQAYIPASLNEWHVAVPSSIKAGTVVLEAANFGTIQHELLVFKSDLPPSGFPLDPDGNIIEDGPGINLVSDGDNLDPGTTQSRTVDLTQPGTYLFLCNIPGHFKAGMYSPVTVTP